MISVTEQFKHHKGLIGFTVLNYIDKGLSFILPLVILYVCKDKTSYNDLEYAYSIGNILVWFFALGSTYSFYGYKIADDRDDYMKFFVFVRDSAIIITSVIMLFFSVVFFNFGKFFFLLNIAITARTVNMLYINYYNNYCRLIDKPSLVLVYGIIINIITIIAIVIAFYLQSSLLLYFSVPQLLFPIIASAGFFRKGTVKKYYTRIRAFYKDALLYSWPVILNCFIGVGITNFGKIFAYNFMSDEDMYIFSYTMRISLVIQLAHASIMTYYSKRVFLGDFNRRIAFAYLLFLLGASALCLIIIAGLNQVASFSIPINTITIIIMLYNIIYSAGSFLEQFYNRVNRNRYILYYSLFAAFFFVVLIVIDKQKTVFTISSIMLIYSIARFGFLGMGLKKVLKLK